MDTQERLVKWANETLKGKWVVNDVRLTPSGRIIGENAKIEEVEYNGVLSYKDCQKLKIPNGSLYYQLIIDGDDQPIWSYSIVELRKGVGRFIMFHHLYENDDPWGKATEDRVFASISREDFENA